jgi:thiol-disulfide isomerase/thioredoxin/cytochrome c556
MRTLLALAVLTAAAVADDPKPPADRAGRVKSIFEELNTSGDKLKGEFQKAKDNESRGKVRQQFMDLMKATTDKLDAVVKEKPDDEPAFDALAFLVGSGDTDAAATLLAKHHLGREKLAGLLPQLADDPSPAVTGLFRAALEKSPPAVQGAACMALGTGLAEQADRGQPTADEAEKLLDRAVKEFGDQPWQDGTIKAAAGQLLFVLRNLSVGKPAPEFASKGLDDKPVKLSDLKGKVVVLDIWATWCGPCRAMIPHERELVKKLEGKPFALVSVSADDKKETLTDFLKGTEMPWTHWYEGDGPALKAWNVRYFPTIYVIDAKGVIRYKGVRGRQMDEAVEALLKEAEGGK